MKRRFIKYDVNVGSIGDIVKQVIDTNVGVIVSCINSNAYVTAEDDVQFKKALLNSDVLIPDGAGIVLGFMVMKLGRINRITGSDIHKALIKEINRKRGTVMYIGSTQSVLEKLSNKVKSNFSNINEIHTYSPPFKRSFDQDDVTLMVEKILDSKTKIVFLGLTAPKQEVLSLKLKQKCPGVSFINVGAVFDFYSGNIKRAPETWQKLGLEWLHRSLLNPLKLGKRNVLSNPVFLMKLIQYRLKSK